MENKIIRSVQVHGFDVFPLWPARDAIRDQTKAFNSKSAAAESPISFDEDKILFDEDDERNHNFCMRFMQTWKRQNCLYEYCVKLNGLKPIFAHFQ